MLFLYVEDDSANRLVMEMMLHYELDNAELVTLDSSTDFEATINRLTPRPEVFLLDLHVKPFNGYQMLSIIRNHPAYRHSKVVAVTASAIHDIQNDLMKAGFDGAISKPIRKEGFAELIGRITSGQHAWCVG